MPMTNKEAINVLYTTSATPHIHPDEQGAWDEAIKTAIESLKQDEFRKNKMVMLYAESIAKSALQNALTIIEDEQQDRRSYFKVFCDSEPSEIAEKMYQYCSEESMDEIIEWLNEYRRAKSEEI